jgi:hypothetical protein
LLRRDQIHGRGLGGHGERQPKRRNLLTKRLGRIGQYRCVDPFERIQRFDLDIKQVDERRRQRSQLRHVAAKRQLSDFAIGLLSRQNEGPPQLVGKARRQVLAIRPAARDVVAKPVPPIELLSVKRQAVADDRHCGRVRSNGEVRIR